MYIQFNITTFLESVLRKASMKCNHFNSQFQPHVRPSNPNFGDFQTDSVINFAKKCKHDPCSLAKLLLDLAFERRLLDKSCISASISQIGFINFILSPSYKQNWINKFSDKRKIKLSYSSIFYDKKIIIDYSSPNMAKQMHVGHLRSIVIGESIKRLFKFGSAKVLTDNHLGDWGSQFGILIMAINRTRYKIQYPSLNKLEDLEGLYRFGVTISQLNPIAKSEADRELEQLQVENLHRIELWRFINSISWNSFKKIYDLMNISFDKVRSESYFRKQTNRVIRELNEVDISAVSQRAIVAFVKNNTYFKNQPFIVLKKDGTLNYSTIDLAAILVSVEKLYRKVTIYITDDRQQDHFRQLFSTVERWFSLKNYAIPMMQHVYFGKVLNANNKAIKTREGDSIKLNILLKESIDRSLVIVRERNSNLSKKKQLEIATSIGISSIRYFDLSQDKSTDYIFSWSKVLSLNGNSAPYILYALVRIYSIFRNSKIVPGQGERDSGFFTTEYEILLLRKIIMFPTILEQSTSTLKPSIICKYLFELTKIYSSFYNANRVISNVKTMQSRRLQLCSRTLSIIEISLNLLGIESLRYM